MSTTWALPAGVNTSRFRGGNHECSPIAFRIGSYADRLKASGWRALLSISGPGLSGTGMMVVEGLARQLAGGHNRLGGSVVSTSCTHVT